MKSLISIPLMCGVALLISCSAQNHKGNIKAPSYATAAVKSINGEISWEISCGFDKIIVPHSQLASFYDSDGQEIPLKQVCEDLRMKRLGR